MSNSVTYDIGNQRSTEGKQLGPHLREDDLTNVLSSSAVRLNEDDVSKGSVVVSIHNLQIY